MRRPGVPTKSRWPGCGFRGVGRRPQRPGQRGGSGRGGPPPLAPMSPTLSLRLRMTLLWCTVSLVLLLGLELLSLAVLSAQLDGAVDNDLALVAHQYQVRVANAT